MARFVGSQTGINDGDYVDLRSKTSEEPFRYLTNFVPTGACNSTELPYNCGWNPGFSPNLIRVGVGLTRERGATRVSTQLIGPGLYQYGSTPWTQFEITDKAKGKYDYAVQNTSVYTTSWGPHEPQHIEPFRPGGETTRCVKDFSCYA